MHLTITLGSTKPNIDSIVYTFAFGTNNSYISPLSKRTSWIYLQHNIKPSWINYLPFKFTRKTIKKHRRKCKSKFRRLTKFVSLSTLEPTHIFS